MACRTNRQKRELVRIVRAPDGAVTMDETGRAAGRGAYLCRDAGCWRLAIEKGALRRALEVPLSVELRDTLLARAAEMTMNDEGGAGGKE